MTSYANIFENLSEHEHQSLLMEWAQASLGRYPDLQWFHAIPNGAKLPYSKDSRGQRYSAQAQRLKKEGLKSGIPDTCLPVPKAQFHGLYIELKRDDGKPSPEQIECLRFLNSKHYFACICFGWESARDVLEWYLSLPDRSFGAPAGSDGFPVHAKILIP